MARKKSIDTGNIGDFPNNQVLEWKPITFAIEFIYQMRRNKKRLVNIPSTRQAVAIPKLITAIYYRKHSLIPDDFIKSAVITTPIEDQMIAREIAYNILFPPRNKEDQKKDPITLDPDELKEESDFMDDLLNVFGSGLDIGNLDEQELIDQELDKFTGLMDFIDDLYDKAAEGVEPQKSLLDIINQRYDFSELLRQGINTLDLLKQLAHQEVLRDMNNLSPQDIQAAVDLEWGNDILNQSNVPWIKTTTEYCMDSPGFEKKLHELMTSQDVGSASKMLNYLKQVGMEAEKLEHLAEQLINNANDLMDIAEISKILGYLPDFDHQKILQNSLNQDLGTSFNTSRMLDRMFNPGLTEELFKMWNNANPDPTLPELFQAQADMDEWKEKVENLVDDLIDDMLNGNGHASYDLADLAQALMNLSTQAEFQMCYDTFLENASKVGMKSLEKATDAQQFEDVLRSLITSSVPLNNAEVMKLGKSKGLSEETILEILGGNYELLKSMFENSIGDFQRYQDIMNNLKLNQAQMDELMQTALSNDNFQGMGALGHENMGGAFTAAGKGSQGGAKAQKKLAESLGIGPGDNLLLQWFMHRRVIPSHVKDFVRKLVKDALIKIALNIISNQRGSGEKGLIPTNKLRSYIEGDDMDLVDIDASIENIVMQGKSLNMITAQDLMVMKTEKGRVAICFLLDISGSMSGMKLAACSIAVMILIGTLRADEVAICFFESNTHVVKEFGDEKDLEDVADELLALEARGGTRVASALEWGAAQLQETSTEMKLCFLLTDCFFHEREGEVQKLLEGYINQRVKFILGVNTRQYGQQYAKWIIDTTQGEMVHILNIPDIPKILTETLQKIG